jgi:hypothetical protein
VPPAGTPLSVALSLGGPAPSLSDPRLVSNVAPIQVPAP